MTIQLVCTPRQLPEHLRVAAAERAIAINPDNRPHPLLVARSLGHTPSKARIAVLTAKRWHTQGVHLTVGFMDSPPAALRKRILSHMNAWAKTANVKFSETAGQAQVRIARAGTPAEMSGYWSYEGTDILSIHQNEPTMNLEAFSLKTPLPEFFRVVRHETGHTLGFPHEHMRRALVARIDQKKAIAFFGATQGWTPDEVRAQVLTPIEEAQLLATPQADQHSIMCYEIPGNLTMDGQPIIGGTDIDAVDYAFAATVYPKPTKAPQAGKAGSIGKVGKAGRPKAVKKAV